MVDKKKARIEELKRISQEALLEEKEFYGINPDVLFVTVGEYYDRDVFKDKTLLKKISDGVRKIRTRGFFDISTGNSFVFVNKTFKIGNIYSDDMLSDMVFVGYHEFRHKLQHLDGFVSPSDKAIIMQERTLQQYSRKDYINRHDQYFMEADANLYGLKRTKSFLKRKYPDIYGNVESRLEAKEHMTDFYLNNYDYQSLFDSFYDICCEENINLTSVPEIGIFF